jgi:hypothetical protein
MLITARNIIDDVRVTRMLVGDHGTAHRLAQFVEVLDVEAELLEGVVLRGWTPTRVPTGRTVGWLLRHDPIVRAIREARCLRVPAASADRRAQ